jgi:hypothetical protein
MHPVPELQTILITLLFSKPRHKLRQAQLGLLRPRRQRLCMRLALYVDIAPSYARLLCAHWICLCRGWGHSIRWHIHTALVRVHFRGTGGRRHIARRRVVAVVLRRRLGVCAVIALGVRLRSVEREMVLWSLTEFPAIRIGHQPLSNQSEYE